MTRTTEAAAIGRQAARATAGLAGAALLARFDWIMYVFGGLLILAQGSAVAPFIYTLF